jgi:uncharacterized damage-inducible protein DinB
MTTAVAILQRLHQHRGWVNENLLAAAAQLNEDELRREFAIGQGSVWKSLVHLHAAEYVWLETLLGDEDPLLPGDLPGNIPGNQLGEGKIASLAELKQKWSELQMRWMAYLAQLQPESLDDKVHKIIMSTRQRMATKRSDILLHVCTHAQYTTAQVINMLRQLGVKKLPESMLISLARREAAGNS